MPDSNSSKSTKARTKRKSRLPHQRKLGCRGVKSRRGQPELYDELKQVVSISITPTGVRGLDEISQALGISRSEFIERIGRRVIQIVTSNTVS
jgi:hypothetical protein